MTTELAADLFDVTITKRWWAWPLSAASLVPMLLLGPDSELWHPSKVEVHRKSDGAILTTFRHLKLSDTRVQYAQLMTSLETNDPATFAESVGLSGSQAL